MELLTQQQLQALLGAPESRRLMELLQQSGEEKLNQAAVAAKAGDYRAVEQLLKPAMQRTEIGELSESLRKKLG